MIDPVLPARTASGFTIPKVKLDIGAEFLLYECLLFELGSLCLVLCTLCFATSA